MFILKYVTKMTDNPDSTCYVGYKFNAELHKQSASLEDQTEETKACQDVDECADNNGDCQHVNTVCFTYLDCRDYKHFSLPKSMKYAVSNCYCFQFNVVFVRTLLNKLKEGLFKSRKAKRVGIRFYFLLNP